MSHEIAETLTKMLERRGVIGYHHYPLADEDTAWDAGEVIRKSDVADLRKICAWFDGANAEDKSAYKLPHHLIKDDEYKTCWRGVAAAMGALLGARGGAKIPGNDRHAVYTHLAKHYKEFKKEPPPFKHA
jgi:hypothetical protein